MTPEHIARLADAATDQWRVYARKWRSMDRVVLYDQTKEILCQAVCSWAGVPLEESKVRQRTRELAALFEGVASIGSKHWFARLARRRLEKWIACLIQDIRAGRLLPPEESAVNIVALHSELNGKLLSPKVAAVELLNVLRPTVAVSVFITFSALAMQEHSECHQKLREGDNEYLEMFVQEVRRFYPFAPFVAARVRHDFEWSGYHFPKGRLALLDLYGTNHDGRIWKKPEEFQPERFLHWDQSLFNFIPQGGGDPVLNHRCPGDWISIELMKVAANFLARRLTYDLPAQDLRFDRSKFPALPRSRFIISDVRSDV